MRFFLIALLQVFMFCKAGPAINQIKTSLKQNVNVQTSNIRSNKIIAVVNSDVVTELDLVRNLKIFTFLHKLSLNQAQRTQLSVQGLNSLIEKRLKAQCVKEFIQMYCNGVPQVTTEKCQQALSSLLERVNISEQKFKQFLEREKIPLDFVLHDFFYVDLAWIHYLQDFYGPNIQISSHEVASYLNHLHGSVRHRTYSVGSIVINKASCKTKELAYFKALEAYEYLKNGASFETVARTYSSGNRNNSESDILLLNESQLSSAERGALQPLSVGQFTNVIENNNNYVIYKLYASRAPGTRIITVATYSRIDFIVSNDQIDTTYYEIISNMADSESFIKNFSKDPRVTIQPAQSVVLDEMENIQLRDFLLKLEPKTLSMPVPVENGLVVFLVHERKEMDIPTPTPDQAYNKLLQKKLSSIEQNKLCSLKSAATIQYYQNTND